MVLFFLGSGFRVQGSGFRGLELRVVWAWKYVRLVQTAYCLGAWPLRHIPLYVSGFSYITLNNKHNSHPACFSSLGGFMLGPTCQTGKFQKLFDT